MFTPFILDRPWNLALVLYNPSYPVLVFPFPSDVLCFVFLRFFGFKRTWYSGEQRHKPVVNGLANSIENVCKYSGSISKTRRRQLDVCVENMRNLSSLLVIILVQYPTNVWALNISSYWSYAFRSSNIGVRTFTDTPWSTCDRLVLKINEKGCFPTERPYQCWPFWRSVVGGDTLSALAPVLEPEQKNLLCYPLPMFVDVRTTIKKVIFE